MSDQARPPFLSQQLPPRRPLVDSHERMKELIANLESEDAKRYQCYRRANIPKGVVRKYLQNVTGGVANKELLIAVRCVVRMFVIEMVAEAQKVMKDWSEEGPIRPIHLREARRRLKKRKLIENVGHKKRLF